MEVPNEAPEGSSCERIADSPQFVFPVYALVLLPLAIYVYHDVLDTRWRPVYRLMKYVVFYTLLYAFSASCLIMYIVIQAACAKDYKEVGASALALILGGYGYWKMLRLLRILFAHKKLVQILQRVDKGLARLSGLPTVGMPYHLFRKPHILPADGKPVNLLMDCRHHYISNSLFDDDYPGEAAARIKWLQWRRINVVEEDAEECASRVALWMRIVLRRPQSEVWKLLSNTSPLLQGRMYHIGLGHALRSIITHGADVDPPEGTDLNPAEILLNPIENDDIELTKAAVGFFWVASEMSLDEMGQVLAEMPPRWMRGVTQNGKQLMFEMVVSMIVCAMPQPHDICLQHVLNLQTRHWRTDIANLKVWKVMAEVLTDAVTCLMPRYTIAGEMPEKRIVGNIVEEGILALQEATSTRYGFQGDIIGLTFIELIRTSFRAGYVAEQLLNSELQEQLERNDWGGGHCDVRLYKAEIVIGMCCILVECGQDVHKEFKTHFRLLKKQWGVDPKIDKIKEALIARLEEDKNDSFNIDDEETERLAHGRCWILGDQRSRCPHPGAAFATLTDIATDLAPLVFKMLQGYLKTDGKITVGRIKGNMDKYREQWLAWKRLQAKDMSGSGGMMVMALP